MKWGPLCLLLALLPPASGAETVSDKFYAAIRSNNLAALETLVKTGGGANLKDDHDVTALMYAAAAGSLEAMKILIAAGADVNAQNAFGSTALMWSVTDEAKVRLLVEHGARVNVASKQGRTPLLLAAASDHSAAIVRFLLARGADAKAVDRMKNTALLVASFNAGDLETLRILTGAGADVNAGDFAGNTALMNAASNGNVEGVKLLLAKGANVNAVSSREILEKVKNGSIALGGFTPLLLATAYGPPEVVKALLDAGAQVNVKDIRGMTPLMLAVATDRQNIEIVRMLLAKGADVKAKSDAGETAYDWARKIGVASTQAALKKAGAEEGAARVIPAASPAPVELRPAVERSVALLEKTSAEFFVTGGCVSCHAQNVTDLAVAAARAKGIAVDEKAALERLKMTKAEWGPAAPMLLERMDPPGAPDTELYAIASLAASNYPPDRMTDGLVANLAAQQWNDGHWHLGGVARPPIEDGDLFRTALSIRALKVYGPPGRAAEMRERIRKAAQWLESAKLVTAEDRNMQLIGLAWADASPALLDKLRRGIVATQKPDGGWAQRPELSSDAYATGQSLYALAASGAAPRDSAYRKGVRYLLSTQRVDGSWHVTSRAPKFQPYFESGFPYGHDQWISSMATGWASMALAAALEPGRQGASAGEE